MTARASRFIELGLWLAVVAMMAALTVVSVRPAREGPLVSANDKICHALAYGAFAAVVLVALRARAPSSAARIALIAFGWAAGYGGMMEIVQLFVGRTADLWDAVANALGAALVVLVWLRLRAWRLRRADG